MADLKSPQDREGQHVEEMLQLHGDKLVQIQGGRTADGSYSDINFTTRANKASPMLMFACATGEHV